jgi:hypothetical protein
MPRNAIPPAIKSIHDPTDRQRAEEAWRATGELISLISQVISIDDSTTGEERTGPNWYLSDEHIRMVALVEQAAAWADTLADLIGGDSASVEGLLKRLLADEEEFRRRLLTRYGQQRLAGSAMLAAPKDYDAHVCLMKVRMELDRIRNRLEQAPVSVVRAIIPPSESAQPISKGSKGGTPILPATGKSEPAASSAPPADSGQSNAMTAAQSSACRALLSAIATGDQDTVVSAGQSLYSLLSPDETNPALSELYWYLRDTAQGACLGASSGLTRLAMQSLALADASRPIQSDQGAGGRGNEDKQKFTGTDKAVLDIIKAQPKGKGIKGQTIVKTLEKQGIEIALSTLKRHIIPKLKASHGVVYERARGGYLIPR